MTNTQAEYPLETMVPLKQGVRELVREGVDISDQVLRYRLLHDQVKGRKINRDWWILKSELFRIIKEQAS